MNFVPGMLCKRRERGIEMFKKALVAIDGSEPSLKAVSTAKAMFKEGSIQSVTLINVIPFPKDLAEKTKIRISEKELRQSVETAAAEIMNKSLQAVGSDIEIEKITEFGPPAEVILQTAEKGDYDLIIMGNRGLNPLNRLLMGSVSSRVLSLAGCSVLIVKE